MSGQPCEPSIGWTPERIAVASRLWGQRKSATHIARELGGVTRNAVIGKMTRLGVERSAGAATSAPTASTRAPQPSRPRRPRVAAPTVPAGPVAEPEHQAEPAALGAAEPLMLKVHELAARSCRWPIGDPEAGAFGFCGDRCSPGGAYCGAHKRIACVPVPNKRRAVRDLERSLRRYL